MDHNHPDIKYRRDDTPRLEMLLGRWLAAGLIELERPSASVEFSEEEARSVYRFKAELSHRKSVWRVVEILGGQTLAEFDRGLRLGFGHDTGEHLSGFWQLIPKGNRKKSFRKTDLATIYPFGGEGENEDLCIAAIGLAPKARLEYVYDFGDWVKHLITLEAVDETPEEGAEYPRVVSQNKARKRYCVSCKEAGQKEVAPHICVTCTEELGKVRPLCATCARKHLDDEHWVEDRRY